MLSIAFDHLIDLKLSLPGVIFFIYSNLLSFSCIVPFYVVIN